MIVALILFSNLGFSQGTWSVVYNNAPDYNGGVMLLLTDGTVMCRTYGGTGYGTIWDKLTPDASGSYANGTWTQLAAMNNDRLYFSTQVLPDGRVYAAGGEYGSGGNKSEVYTPKTNTWAPNGNLSTQLISDANSELLASGKILQATVLDTESGTAYLSQKTFLYNASSASFASGPSTNGVDNESVWVKLPDGSVLFCDRNNTGLPDQHSERYIPSSNSWVVDATVPVELYDAFGSETGAAFLLPNGKVIFFGSTSTTALYTPSGTSSAGTWTTGPTIPNGLGAPDAAAAMMNNGKILLALSPTPYGTASSDIFTTPVYFYEYDYSSGTSGTFTEVTNMIGSDTLGTSEGIPGTYITNMLDLPDGNVLFSFQGDDQYYLYTPSGSPISAGKPTVSSVISASCDSFTITGTNFNGISEGAAYGDDWQMSTNYPSIRLTSGSNVYYCTTTHWNRIGAVMTSTALDTAQFTLPSGLPAGTYSLQVVVNGNPSSTYSFTNGVASISPSSPSLCAGTSTTLTDATGGGTWSSSNTSVATVNTSGVVSGVASGTSIISYASTCGAASVVVTVKAVPTVSDPSNQSVCNNQNTSTVTFSGTGTSYSWTNSNTSIGLVSSGFGNISSFTATNTGSSPISGIISVTPSSSSCTGTAQSFTVTVNPTPTVNSVSNQTLCNGTASTLVNFSGAVTGTTYSWVNSNTSIGEVASGTGYVASFTSTNSGTSPIAGVFTVTPSAAGCTGTVGTFMITVNPTPTVTVPSNSLVCNGSADGPFTFSGAVSGTTFGWVNNNTSIGVGSSGTGTISSFTASNSGTSEIQGVFSVTPTANSCLGSVHTFTVGVNPTPNVNSVSNVSYCNGASTTAINFSGAVTSATYSWTNSNTAIGLSSSGTGNISSFTATNSGSSPISGTLTVTPSASGCSGVAHTFTVTVNPSATAGTVSGATSVSVGSSITLTDGVSGGAWTSGATSIATIGSSTGIVTGVASGTVILSYTVTGCGTAVATHLVTVSGGSVSGITGTSSMCAGGSTSLSDATSGGTWSSNDTAVATVNSSGVVSGVSPGTATISYTVSGTSVTYVITVNPEPGPITIEPSTTADICLGSSVSFSAGVTLLNQDFNSSMTGEVGGTWNVVNVGISPYNWAITSSFYGDESGSGITGDGTPCINADPDEAGEDATLNTQLISPAFSTVGYASASLSFNHLCYSQSEYDSVAEIDYSTDGGSTWTLMYNYLNTVTGSNSWVEGVPDQVISLPSGALGHSSVMLRWFYVSDYGYWWVVDNINLTGIPSTSYTWTGISGASGLSCTSCDNPTITPTTTGTFVYSVSTTSGSCSATSGVTVVVHPTPAPIVSDTTILCPGSATTLTDITTGGVWISSNPAVAVVDSVGDVTALSGGMATISYEITGGCASTVNITVEFNSVSGISGNTTVTAGFNTYLRDSTPGGIWSSSNATVASVDSTGNVTGVSAGSAIISYSLSNSCGSYLATAIVTVLPASSGFWTSLINPAPDYNGGVMLVMTDGSILCKTYTGGTYGTTWDKLTPDSHGSYVNGTWSSITPMHDDRLYFSSQVLQDGRVYVAGGEYGSGGTKGEVYDPVSNTWTECPQVVTTENISDANSELLPDGTVLQSVVDTADAELNFIWHPATNTYTPAASCLLPNNEAAWVKLPDSSIVFIDYYGLESSSERYIPAEGEFINDGTVPEEIFDPYGYESGAALLLPNGKGFFIGSLPTTLYYTPSGNTSPGTWTNGPAIPNNQGAPDAPAAMMVNGKILLVVSPTPRSSDHFPDSSTFYEFDYTNNSFTQVPSPLGGSFIDGTATYIQNMVCLPDGNILFSFQGDDQYYVYSPNSTPLSAGKPAVTSVSRVNCDTFTATGTLFNGLCDGASYGDDWQMASNYPLIRLIASDSTVHYAKTYNWNRTGVKTGSLPDTVHFILPSGVTAGSYTLQVVANGNASDGVSFNPGLPITPATTSVCVGASTTLTDTWNAGAWVSHNSSIATVGSSSGIVTGVAAGSVVISYIIPTGCMATATITVNPLPSAGSISGSSAVCVGGSITLTDGTGSGIWTSSNTGVAHVGSGSGVVTGVSAGPALISYTVTNGCGSTSAVHAVTVNPTPVVDSIGGPTVVCVGANITLFDGVTGGTWTSSNTGLAIVTGGTVTGISAGAVTITYTVSTSCGSSYMTYPITVNPLPNAGTITGAYFVSVGGSVTLTDAASGGTWSSSNTSVATVTGGVVSGVSSGVVVISYSVTNSCGTAIATKTLNSYNAGTISGVLSVCVGNTTSLSDSASGGTWTSSNVAVATVGSTGVVTGVAGGVALISYDVSGAVTYVSVTVNAVAAAIAGSSSVCVGASTTLVDATSGGTWSASSGATIGTTGMVTGVSPGVVVISYTMPGNCGVAFNMTVGASPLPVSGPAIQCTGQYTQFSDVTTGGVWISGNTSAVTIGSLTGAVYGVAPGVATLSYSVSGCNSTQTVTVNSTPYAVTGTSSICAGASTTYTDATTGGTWSSTNSSIAGVTSGIVSGVSAGTAVISYSVASGCANYKSITIFAAPLPIIGPSVQCTGTATQFADSTSGGAWSSSNTSAATVGVTTGVVNGIAATSVATITYSVSGCNSYKTVSVYASPNAVSGTAAFCAGASSTYSDITTGGIWSSTNTAVATVITTGLVTGISAGTSVISYSVASGCASSKVVTINAAPVAIVGVPSLCSGASVTFTDATPGGSWSSSNTSSASVGATTGIVTGMTGTSVATISYSVSGCASTQTLTVYATPNAVGGVSSICSVASTTFTDATPGGTWSSSNSSVATVGTTGIVSGVAAGTLVISYTVSGCSSSRSLTVNAAPTAITGVPSLCASTSVTFTDGVSGGVWTSSNTSSATVGAGTGIVMGISGTSVTSIIYNISGCTASYAVTVNAAPSAVSGTASICAGTSATYTDITTGGSWSSSTSSVATVGSLTGVVSGLSSGTSTISYTATDGCSSVKVVSVAGTLAAIVGPAVQCTSQATQFTDATSGGTWVSSNTSAATVGATTGIVTGVAAAPATISYSAGGCTATKTITVYATPYAIVGASAVCTGATTGYSDATSGGTWSVTNASLATFSGSSLTGVAVGTTTISYTTASGCASTKAFTVNPAPGPITGPVSLCTGLTYNFTDGTPGGVWSSSNTSGATVNPTTGVVTGVAYSAEFISYTISGCYTTEAIAVNPSPYAIVGAASVSIASSTTFSDASSGGVWSSGNATVATVSSTSGNVTGVALGTTLITYTLSTGCNVTRSITVIPISGRDGGGTTTDGANGTGNATGEPVDVKILPNPNKGEFIIRGSLGSDARGEVVLQVTDMLGQVVFENHLTVENGMINELVQLNNSLANGMYILNIHSGQVNEAYHFVVTK